MLRSYPSAPRPVPMADPATRSYRWSREVYDRAVEAGIFGPGDLIELIEGELLTMTPQGSRHAAVATRVAARLGGVFGSGCHVRTQMPLAAGAESEPEPDVAVVDGSDFDYLDAHPATALLVVEVSDDSLGRDRSVKQRLYARCDIPEYWIVAIPEARPGGSPEPDRRRLPHGPLLPCRRVGRTARPPGRDDCRSRSAAVTDDVRDEARARACSGVRHRPGRRRSTPTRSASTSTMTSALPRPSAWCS